MGGGATGGKRVRVGVGRVRERLKNGVGGYGVCECAGGESGSLRALAAVCAVSPRSSARCEPAYDTYRVILDTYCVILDTFVSYPAGRRSYGQKEG